MAGIIDRGWGAGPWGLEAWGSPGSLALDVLKVSAIAENVIRVYFSQALYFSTLLDAKDAADPSKYTIAPIAGTVGMDGLPTRAVTVASVAAVADTDLPQGTVSNSVLDLTTDRPMSPWPGAYELSIANVWTADGLLEIDASTAVFDFLGLYRVVVVPSLDTGHPLRDFGNPQTIEAQQATQTSQPSPRQISLGTFYVQDGDYGLDQGIASIKKRIYRRLVTAPGGFAHLGNSYGVGVPQQAKKLLQTGTLNKLSALAEQQIGQEPEVKAVRVRAAPDPANTGLVNFYVSVSLRVGRSATFVYPFSAAAAA